MMNPSEILNKYASRKITLEEERIFQTWVGTLSSQELNDLLDEYGEMVVSQPAWQEDSDQVLLSMIHQQILIEEAALTQKPIPRIHFLRRWRWAVAVILGVSISIGGYFLFSQHEPATLSYEINQPKSTILPGKDGAILTLADGTQMVLDSLGNGVIARQNGTEVILSGSQLVYSNSNAPEQELSYNMMTTPNGRQFHLVLPDGSHVWLNAGSSIRYPIQFIGKERKVTITGEAYFEIAADPLRPFQVRVNERLQIEVLGTQFNVSAYANDPVPKTTLVSGAVKVNGVPLKPGQQAQITDQTLIVNGVNIDKAVAWRNGLFNFEGARLDEVMRELERWYDIEVVYPKGIPSIEFGGEMTRNISLDGLLIALEKSAVHYKIDGKKLIILP